MKGLGRATFKTLVLGTAVLLSLSGLAMYATGRAEGPPKPAPIGAAATQASPDRSEVPTTVHVVANPGAVVAERLSKLPGGQCQAAGSAMLLPLRDLDSRVVEAGGPGRWLDRDIWIGDLESASEAFGSTWAGRSSADPWEAWIESSRNGKTVALQLIGVKTGTGTEVWRTAGSIVIAKCDPNG